MQVSIKCTKSELIAFKQNLKSNDNSMTVAYKVTNDKPPDMTCGEYIVGMIKWEVVDE